MEEAQAWCKDKGNYPYFESAKDAINIAAAFEEGIGRVLTTDDRSDHLIQTLSICMESPSLARPVDHSRGCLCSLISQLTCVHTALCRQDFAFTATDHLLIKLN